MCFRAFWASLRLDFFPRFTFFCDHFPYSLEDESSGPDRSGGDPSSPECEPGGSQLDRSGPGQTGLARKIHLPDCLTVSEQSARWAHLSGRWMHPPTLFFGLADSNIRVGGCIRRPNLFFFSLWMHPPTQTRVGRCIVGWCIRRPEKWAHPADCPLTA